VTASRFYKMTGSGNDFVVLDARTHAMDQWSPERIALVCDRRRGVGADGVVFVGPSEEPAREGRPRAVRMAYFNADGSHANMCGNAALCATRLAVRLGLADPERVVLETDAGWLESRCVGQDWAAELLFPTAEIPIPIEIPLVAGERSAFQGTVGVPHTVIVVADLETVDVAGRGRSLRFDPRFGLAGTNVNFVGPDRGQDADWSLRTYERGVEGETLACGTGTIAAALALAAGGACRMPVRIRSRSGLIYGVSGRIAGATADEVWLCGEGRLVFSGEFAAVE